jgi:hypothetical protein
VPTLKKYIQEQCADPVFRAKYEGFCEICPVTVALVARLHESGLMREEIAARSGVSPADLADLEEAERCSYAVVAKLSAWLGVPGPKKCGKMAADDPAESMED